MNIVYLGAISVRPLAESFKFDRPVASIRRSYPFGTALVRGLTYRGHHVSVIVANSSLQQIEVFRSAACDIWMIPERKCRYQYPTLYSKELALMRSCIAQIKPDVCVANWTYQYARGALTSGCPTLVIARDSPWRCLWHMKTWMMLFRSFYSQFFVFPYIKHMSTISPHMVEDLRRFNGYKGDVTVIPNGIETRQGRVEKVEGVERVERVERVEKVEKIHSSTSTLNFNSSPKEIRETAKTIVCVSEWNRLKNSRTLFRAFEILHRRHADWRLLVVGNYMDEKGAGPWMEKAGVSSEGVTLLGLKTQAEIKKLLQDEADVFCSPTLEESFGQVFLEAMAQGVPCVGGERSGAVPWVLGAEERVEKRQSRVENVEKRQSRVENDEKVEVVENGETIRSSTSTSNFNSSLTSTFNFNSSLNAEVQRRRAEEKIAEWLAGVDEKSFDAALEKLMAEKCAAGEYRFNKPEEQGLALAGAKRFYREFSRKIVPLSDGRCVYFAPDARAKIRNGSNTISWAEYAFHAVSNGGVKISGKNYNERWYNPYKVAAFEMMDAVLKQEHCFIRLSSVGHRYDAIVFAGDETTSAKLQIVTRLDEMGNMDANLSEVTFTASSKEKKLPRFVPLARAVRTVVHYQTTAGSNPPNGDSLANRATTRKGGERVERVEKRQSRVEGVEDVESLGNRNEEVGNDNAGGVVCDVAKPEKLAECLERVMLDWELRKRLSAGGVLRAQTVFNMKTVVRQYEAELMRVAREG